jgi:hypothetical protein
MPPHNVNSIKNLIYWQYSKLYAESKGNWENFYSEIVNKYNKLKSGENKWLEDINNFIDKYERKNECIYCGSKGDIFQSYLMQIQHGGLNTTENMIHVCPNCDSSRENKLFYDWWYESVPIAKSNGLFFPSLIAEVKYLKLLYDLHDNKDTLNVVQNDLQKLCKSTKLVLQLNFQLSLVVLTMTKERIWFWIPWEIFS